MALQGGGQWAEWRRYGGYLIKSSSLLVSPDPGAAHFTQSSAAIRIIFQARHQQLALTIALECAHRITCYGPEQVSQ